MGLLTSIFGYSDDTTKDDFVLVKKEDVEYIYVDNYMNSDEVIDKPRHKMRNKTKHKKKSNIFLPGNKNI